MYSHKCMAEFAFLVESVVVDFKVGVKFLRPKGVVGPDTETHQRGPDADGEANPEAGAEVQRHLHPVDHQVAGGPEFTRKQRPENHS